MAERHNELYPFSHLPKQMLCVNWHHFNENSLTVAGLHRAHPSASLDKSKTINILNLTEHFIIKRITFAIVTRKKNGVNEIPTIFALPFF